MKVYMFPGQGSQTRGMGAELFDTFPEITQHADEILGYSIKSLCLEDKKRQLNKTQFTQVAIYIVNALSYMKKIQDGAQKPDFVIGHSLGEFNALLAAECFDFVTGLKIVKRRGELMAQAKNGSMAAVLNSSKQEIIRLLDENNLKNVSLANFNTLSQIIISGATDEIDKALSVFSFGDVTCVPLNTSGAFHSKFMRPLQDQFEQYLKEFNFSPLLIPVISNVSALPYDDSKIIDNLSQQMSNEVKWVDSMQFLMDKAKSKDSEVEFEEVGNGEVLTKILLKFKLETESTYGELVKVVDINKVASEINKTNTSKTNTSKSEIETSNKITKNISAEVIVNEWNSKHGIGTKVKSTVVEGEVLETRTEALVLFGHRAAIYMKGYKGYFALDELQPV